jgi:hypothetical protein
MRLKKKERKRRRRRAIGLTAKADKIELDAAQRDRLAGLRWLADFSRSMSLLKRKKKKRN